MIKFYKAVLLFSVSVLSLNAFAGNDTKRGQGGATELLVNPWARSSGMANSILAGVNGVEAMNLNVAGTSYTTGTDIMFASTRYLSGSDINITALGLTTKVSEFGVMGISFTGWSLGDFMETRFDQPEGTGATFSPNIFNIGLSYSQQFSEKITGIPKENQEELQVATYEPNGKFVEHFDSCIYEDREYCNRINHYAGERRATLLIYLNNDFKDGETEFVELGLNIPVNSLILTRKVTLIKFVVRLVPSNIRVGLVHPSTAT
jgi:hypothetical protein